MEHFNRGWAGQIDIVSDFDDGGVGQEIMNKTTSIPIGKIVKSNTHIDYVCQVYNLGEQPILPHGRL